EHRLHPIDTPIFDLERLHERERVRPLEKRPMLLAVGRLVMDEGVVVIEEARRDDDAALLVDERIATLAHAFVDAKQTEPELCLASLGDRCGTEAASRRADPV